MERRDSARKRVLSQVKVCTWLGISEHTVDFGTSREVTRQERYVELGVTRAKGSLVEMQPLPAVAAYVSDDGVEFRSLGRRVVPGDVFR